MRNKQPLAEYRIFFCCCCLKRSEISTQEKRQRQFSLPGNNKKIFKYVITLKVETWSAYTRTCVGCHCPSWSVNFARDKENEMNTIIVKKQWRNQKKEATLLLDLCPRLQGHNQILRIGDQVLWMRSLQYKDPERGIFCKGNTRICRSGKDSGGKEGFINELEENWGKIYLIWKRNGRPYKMP